MKPGNKFGLAGFACLGVAVVFLRAEGRLLLVSLLSQWCGLGLLVTAGVKRPRWWFAIPFAILAVYVWALSQGH